MSNILTIGLVTEGPTDERLLAPLIERCYLEMVMECKGMVEVFPVQTVKSSGDTFAEKVLNAAKQAQEYGLNVLCVHVDADASNDDDAFGHRITPAFSTVAASAGSACKNLVALVPIRMTEAWMLVDYEKLADELGTELTARQLGIPLRPETVADPKFILEEAIRIALAPHPKRSIRIGELYQPLGQTIALELLRQQASYRKFEDAARESLRALNYLH